MARTCDGCGRKMSPWVPRKKNAAGQSVCEGCLNGREGRPLSRHAEQQVIRAQAHLTPDPAGQLIKVAHGNMDGVTVFHCPFCGSGQVVNEGTSIACGFCHTSFTVLVQPQFPMMPATVEGQPYTPGVGVGGGPGTPPPAAGPAQPAPTADDDEGSFGGDPLSEKANTDGGDEGKPDDSKPADDDKDKNPFAKGSSLVTAQGVALPVDQFMAHLALKHSPDRERTLAEVQQGRANV